MEFHTALYWLRPSLLGGLLFDAVCSALIAAMTRPIKVVPADVDASPLTIGTPGIDAVVPACLGGPRPRIEPCACRGRPARFAPGSHNAHLPFEGKRVSRGGGRVPDAALSTKDPAIRQRACAPDKIAPRSGVRPATGPMMAATTTGPGRAPMGVRPATTPAAARCLA